MTPIQANFHPAYRPDIDGLRAVAVLSVVLYHAFPGKGGGGFIGVDIFFVISGYLISKIVFAEVDAGRFSYAKFYGRRIRRIFPALLLVLSACLVFAATTAFPSDSTAIGKQVLAGAGFAANLLFWHDAGYFDGSSELKPLLHLWSLSVEEQYYIVWPAIVGLAWKRKRLFGLLLTALTLASLIFNIGSIATGHADAAFYSPLSRAWELLLGAWLALDDRGRFSVAACQRRLGAAGRQAVAVFGALLIVAGLALIRPDSAFPGGWALLPTVGAVCLIGAGPDAWFNTSILSSRLAVFFGKISYPLYLWHWPLLALPKVYLGHDTRNHRILGVVAAVVLAWLTYRFVEKPIRYGSRRLPTPMALVGVMLVFAACGGMLVASDGWLDRLPHDMREIAMARAVAEDGRNRPGRCFLAADQKPSAFSAECDTGGHPPGRSVVVWGDSHAAALYPGLKVLIDTHPAIRLGQFTATACPPVLDVTIRQRPNCRAVNDEVWKRLASRPPHTVVMAANWTYYNGENGMERLDVDALTATAARLRQAGVVRVVLVGPFERWHVEEPLILLRQWRDTGAAAQRSRESFNDSTFEFDALVRTAASRAGVDVVSPLDKLCDPTGCLLTLTVDGKRYPISFDDAHLTAVASEVLARELLDVYLPK